MPFTPTHIVAIIPIAAVFQRMPLSALAIGAMIPDLPMFFPIARYAQTHSPLGVFTTCLPLGMTAFVLFQCVVKVPLLLLLPRWFQVRLSSHSPPLLLPSFLFFSLVALSIVGAFTHIVWDAFTHQGLWGVKLLPVLNNEVSIAGWSMPGYKAFQYGSSVVGLPLLAILSWRSLSDRSCESESGFIELHWIVKASTIACFLVVPVTVAAVIFHSDSTFYEKLGRSVTTCGSVLVVLVLVYCLLVQMAVIGNRTSDSGTKEPKH